MSKQKLNRNDPCFCGSGKKYKQCCLLKENSVAKYTSQGKMKFSAVVLNDNSFNCIELFKKYSSKEGQEAFEKNLQEYSISKEKLSKMSKKQLKQLEKEEEKKYVEQLQKHSFEVLDASTKQENIEGKNDSFIPSDEDFRVSS